MDIRNQMMRVTKGAIAAMLLGGVVVPAASAADFSSRWYGGLGLGISELEPDPNGTAVRVDESRSSGGKLFIGYDFTKRFSLEGHYADLGEAKMSPAGEVGYKEMGLGGLYYLLKQRPAHEGFGLYAKVGVGKMENDTDLRYERVNDYSLFYGAGLEYAFSNGLALRGEVELYDEDARMATLSLLKRFGGTRKQQPVAKEPPPQPEPVAVAPAPVVPEAPKPAPKPPVTLGELEVIYFHTDSAALTRRARAKLDRLAEELKRVPDAHLEVAGHTDNRATSSYNLVLSKQRVRTVIDYLTQKGISVERLRPVAYGETRPVASNATEEGRRLNRRVEFRELER